MTDNTEKIEESHEHSCHNQDCGCHSHEHGNVILSDAHKWALIDLAEYSCLPISRCIMSSKEKDVSFVSLSPVFINDLDDSMETVKQIGAILSDLEKKDLITLDYDIPIRGYDYEKYKDSALYSFFKQTVKEGSERTDSLCDTAEIELGSMTVTEYGMEVLNQFKV